jgi:hypothetical protein
MEARPTTLSHHELACRHWTACKTGELETVVQTDMLRAHFNTRIMDFGKKQIDISIRDDDNRPGCCDVVAIPVPIAGDDPIVNFYPINTLKSEANLAVRIGLMSLS